MGEEGLRTKGRWDIKIKDIPPWSYPDAAAAGPAAATSAAASAVCIYYVVIGGRFTPRPHNIHNPLIHNPTTIPHNNSRTQFPKQFPAQFRIQFRS